MRFFVFLFSLAFLFSCQPNGKAPKSPSKVEKQESWHYALLADSVFIPMNKEGRKKKQIELLSSFFHADWDYSNYECLLLKDKGSPKYPFSNISFQIKDNFKNYKATLMALSDISKNLSLAKVGFFFEKYGFTSVGVIYDFLIVEKNGKFKLANVFNYRTRNWKEKTFGKIDYHAYPGYHFDKKEINRMQNFNVWTANYFHVNPMSFTYYVCKSYKQTEQIHGFDFERLMYVDDSYGGYSIPREKVIFAGNNSEYYPHELVHLYVHSYFPYANAIIDEGLATYLGGSRGMGFKKHLHILKKHLKTDKIDILNKLMTNDGYIPTDKVSLKYSVGALLCALAVKKCGKQGLMSLLDSGKSNEDLLLAVEKLFGVDKAGFNGFVEKNLEQY